MPAEPAFTTCSSKPEVARSDGAVQAHGMATTEISPKALFKVDHYFKGAGVRRIWVDAMLESLDRLQTLLQLTSPDLAETVRKMWTIVKEVTSEPRKGSSTPQDVAAMLQNLWMNGEEATIERSRSLTDTISRMLDVLLGFEIHKDALVLSNILPTIESLLSFPITGVRTKSVRLVNKWRVIMDLHPSDEEVARVMTQETNHISARELCYQIVLVQLIKNIEDARSMDARSMKLGIKAVNTFMTFPMTKDILTETKVLLQIQEFETHPFSFIRKRCIELAARWNLLLTTKPPANDPSLEVDAPKLSEMATHTEDKYSDDALVLRDTEEQHSLPLQDVLATKSEDEFLESDLAIHDAEEHHGLPPRDLHEKPLLALLRWTTDTIWTLKPSAARNSLFNKLADYDLQMYDDFMAWIKTFTNIDDSTLSRVKPELSSFHAFWRDIVEEIQNVTKARTQSEVRMKAIHDEVLRLEKKEASLIARGLKDQVELVKNQASEANTAQAELKTVIEMLDSPIIWQYVHEEMMIRFALPIRRMVDKAAEQKKMRKLVDEEQAKEISVLKRAVEMGPESNPKEESDIIAELRRDLTASKSMIDRQGQSINNQKETVQAQRRILDANESSLAGMRSELESAMANMTLEMGNQRSKYDEDVKKGVDEMTIALRQQLNEAKLDASLYTQIFNENDELERGNKKLRQDKAELSAAKWQKERESKAAKDATRISTEGYDQLKKTNAELKTSNIELEAANDYLLQERNDLRNAVQSLKAEALLSQESPTENATVTSPVWKYARELQHLDSTISIWERDLAAAQAKKKTSQDKKIDIDTQIAELARQIKALKEPKGNTSEKLPPPPGAPEVQDAVARHLAPDAPQCPQTQEESPSPPAAPRVRLPVDTTSRGPPQSQFSALAAEFTSLQTRYL